MELGLPLAAHGNPTGLRYTGERNINLFFSLGRSGNGKSMDFFGRGRNCQQSFSGFKVEATLEGEKFHISSRKKGKRITRSFATIGGVVGDCRSIPAYLPRPLGCFTNSHGPSDRATDHGPMIFAHSRLVKPPLTHSLTQPPGSGLVALSPSRIKSTNTDIILRLFLAFKNPAPL